MHECRTCSKQFQSAEALLSHQKSIHAKSESSEGSSRSSKRYISGIFIVGVLLLLGYGAVTIIAPASESDVALAQCIANSGAKFYGAFWCSHCNDQKELFGGAARYLPYIECSNSDKSQKQICRDAGIDAYPTWVFADGTRGNVLTKAQLAQRTGCPFS